jgi:hypothetical protein
VIYGVIDNRVRRAAQKTLGQGSGLREQTPWPEAESEPGVGAVPDCCRRQDVEHGKLGDAAGMVERHPIGNASSTIMAGHGEPVKVQNTQPE